jgi:hypothetical protein
LIASFDHVYKPAQADMMFHRIMFGLETRSYGLPNAQTEQHFWRPCITHNYIASRMLDTWHWR